MEEITEVHVRKGIHEDDYQKISERNIKYIIMKGIKDLKKFFLDLII